MMRQNKTLGQMLLREFGAAFGVLALVFLSFAHQPVFAQVPTGSVIDGTFYVSVDFCGDGPAGSDQSTVSGCEACRIAGGLALPVVANTGFEFSAPQTLLGVPYTKADRASLVCAATVHPRAPPVSI